MRHDPEPGLAAVSRALAGRGLPLLEMYKEKCLRRRLAVRMRAAGVHSLEEYADLLERVPAEGERLLAALTINVTHFFRNPEVWDALAPHVLPRLRERGAPLRCWSAGCATGEEPYTVAMLVGELAAAAGRPEWMARLVIDASDVDPDALRRARLGRYPETSFGAALPARAHPWITGRGTGEVTVVPPVARTVRFHQQDLGASPPPAPPYDLIVCRNVVIYFGRNVQEQLFQTFAASVVPGGLLLLGQVETLVGPAREQFVPADVRARLYRRIG